MLKPKQINHVTVLVSDKERARDFYCNTLGLTEYRVANDGLWVRAGSQYVHITSNSGLPIARNFYHFAIGFDNFQEALAELISSGIVVFDLDQNLKEVDVNTNLDAQIRQFFVRDPDGNLVEIFDMNAKYFNPDF